MTFLKAVEFDVDKRAIGALCRPPTLEGLGERPFTSDEAGNFINALLELEGDQAVTSHRLKATTLTRCSKYGLDERSRTLLGHHELPSRSLACYSREMLSRPLAHYQAMLKTYVRATSYLMRRVPEGSSRPLKILSTKAKWMMDQSKLFLSPWRPDLMACLLPTAMTWTRAGNYLELKRMRVPCA